MSRGQSQSGPSSLTQTVLLTVGAPLENSSGDSDEERSERPEGPPSSESDEPPQGPDCRVRSRPLDDEKINQITCHGCSKIVHKVCRSAFRLADTHEMTMCTTCVDKALAWTQEIRQEGRDNQCTWRELLGKRFIKGSSDQDEACHIRVCDPRYITEVSLTGVQEWPES